MPFLPIDITLVMPPLAVSTPVVYRAWDDLGGPNSDGPNDLEAAALAAYPELLRWRDRIGDLAGQAPTLTGSGATWFLLGHHDLGPSLPDGHVVRTTTCA